MWTHFWDMHSGGGLKEPPYSHIFIEAAKAEATIIFYNRFGHNPNRVSCTCCGEDYSIREGKTLAAVSGFERGLRYDKKANTYVDEPAVLDPEWLLEPNKYQSEAEFLARGDVLVIKAANILPAEREGNVPEQGYIWVGG
jgi:hypothetical protein